MDVSEQHMKELEEENRRLKDRVQTLQKQVAKRQNQVEDQRSNSRMKNSSVVGRLIFAGSPIWRRNTTNAHRDAKQFFHDVLKLVEVIRTENEDRPSGI